MDKMKGLPLSGSPFLLYKSIKKFPCDGEPSDLSVLFCRSVSHQF